MHSAAHYYAIPVVYRHIKKKQAIRLLKLNFNNRSFEHCVSFLPHDEALAEFVFTPKFFPRLWAIVACEATDGAPAHGSSQSQPL